MNNQYAVFNAQTMGRCSEWTDSFSAGETANSLAEKTGNSYVILTADEVGTYGVQAAIALVLDFQI